MATQPRQYLEPQPIGVGPSYGAQESLTVSSTVVPLTYAHRGYNMALITVETASIRFWLNGQNPSTTAGHLLNSGDVLELDSAEQIDGARFIRTAADATLMVSYGK